jgi:hypothetical protein
MKVRVKSVPERFRRAGIDFTRQPQEIDVDEKTLKILNAEPMLVFEEISEETEKKEKKGK